MGKNLRGPKTRAFTIRSTHKDSLEVWTEGSKKGGMGVNFQEITEKRRARSLKIVRANEKGDRNWEIGLTFPSLNQEARTDE